MHHNVSGAPSSDSTHEFGSPVQGDEAWYPRVANIGKFDYLKWGVLRSVDVLSLPFMFLEVMWHVKLMRLTSEARTSIELEISITDQAAAIERIAALEVIWKEVRIIDVYVLHNVLVWWLPIYGIVSFNASRAYLFKIS